MVVSKLAINKNKETYQKFKDAFAEWLKAKPRYNEYPPTHLEYLINLQAAFNAGAAFGKQLAIDQLEGFIKQEKG